MLRFPAAGLTLEFLLQGRSRKNRSFSWAIKSRAFCARIFTDLLLTFHFRDYNRNNKGILDIYGTKKCLSAGFPKNG